jgi:CBS domain containing-hemolysin-like protein
MMASNRYRLKHRAQRGSRSAKLAMSLLAQTDRLLGVILLGNTLVAAAAATLTAVITKRLFGEASSRCRRHRRDLVRAARVLRDHAQGRRAPPTPTRSRRS